jgi:hypothetical protein
MMSIHHAAVVFLIVVFSAVSQARDYGQYKNVQPEIKSWIESLRDASGVSCCATADGYQPEAVEWDMAGNHYRVKIDNNWIGCLTALWSMVQTGSAMQLCGYTTLRNGTALGWYAAFSPIPQADRGRASKSFAIIVLAMMVYLQLMCLANARLQIGPRKSPASVTSEDIEHTLYLPDFYLPCRVPTHFTFAILAS